MKENINYNCVQSVYRRPSLMHHCFRVVMQKLKHRSFYFLVTASGCRTVFPKTDSLPPARHSLRAGRSTAWLFFLVADGRPLSVCPAAIVGRWISLLGDCYRTNDFFWRWVGQLFCIRYIQTPRLLSWSKLVLFRYFRKNLSVSRSFAVSFNLARELRLNI